MTIFSSLYGTRLDRELGTDDSTILFTTARRKSAINEAQEEFSELTECLQRSSTMTATGGTAEYDLNSAAVVTGADFVRFSNEPVQFWYTDASSNVTVLSGDDLPRRDVDWLDRYQPGWQVSTVNSSVQQLPSLYYVREEGSAKFLGFWPTPSTGSSASMKVVIPYLARPAALTTDAAEPFTVNSSVRIDLRSYHQALVHFAAHHLEKLRQDDGRSDRQLQKFLGYVARFLQNRRPRNGLALTFARSYFRSGRRSSQQKDPRT